MIIQVSAIPADQFFHAPLAIPLFADLRPPHREAGRVDFRLGGLISRWIDQGEIDPSSPTPTMVAPGSADLFPQLVIAGAGTFHELSAPAAERVIAGMVETLLRARPACFGIAGRDFKQALTPARDSSEIILRGIAHGCDLAGIHSGHTIRVYWEEEQVELLVQELRRFRYHLPPCREWQIDRSPEDQQWRGPGQS